MKKLAIVSLLFFITLTPVSALAACTTTKTSGSFKVGSTTNSTSVTVCVSSSAASTSTKTSTAVTTKKVVVKAPAAPPPCIIKVSSAAAVNDPKVPGCSYVVVAPVVNKVVTATPTTSVTTSVSSQLDQQAFTPDPVSISASSATAVVGQTIFFSSEAAAHTKSATILGKPAQVAFSPMSFDWGGGSGASYATSWLGAGVYQVGVTVTYAASYSLGAGWIDAGLISSWASVSVSVSEVPAPVVVVPRSPRLVFGNCIGRPSAYRC